MDKYQEIRITMFIIAIIFVIGGTFASYRSNDFSLLNDENSKLFENKKIVKHFNTIFSEAPPEVPDYVADNLSHKLRPYQEHALSQYLEIWGIMIGLFMIKPL